jgi:hypothetical protein
MTFNHLNRRTHLFLALALLPWVLIYGISSLIIHHRDWFNPEMPYTATFSEDTERWMVAGPDPQRLEPGR